MAAVIKLKGFDGASPIRVRGTAERDEGSQRVIARDGELITGEFPFDKIEIWYNESDPGVVSDQSQSLRPDHRLRLAWALAWPALVVDLAYQLIRAQSTAPEELLRGADLALAAMLFFLLEPWVVRRMVGLQFPDFHLSVIRRTGAASREMSYSESLSITWLRCWRTCVILLPVLLIIAILRGKPDWEWTAPLRLFVAAAGFLVSYLWIVPAAIRKNYAGFSLKLERTSV